MCRQAEGKTHSDQYLDVITVQASFLENEVKAELGILPETPPTSLEGKLLIRTLTLAKGSQVGSSKVLKLKTAPH